MFLLIIELLKFKTIQSKINQLLFIIEALLLSMPPPPLQTTNSSETDIAKAHLLHNLLATKLFAAQHAASWPQWFKFIMSRPTADVPQATCVQTSTKLPLKISLLDTHQQKQLQNHMHSQPQKEGRIILETIGFCNAKMWDSVTGYTGHWSSNLRGLGSEQTYFPGFFCYPFHS